MLPVTLCLLNKHHSQYEIKNSTISKHSRLAIWLRQVN